MVFLVKTVFSMQFNVLFMWQNSICQNKNAPQWNLEGQVIRPKTMKQNGLFLTEKKTIKNWIKFDWFFIVDKWNECQRNVFHGMYDECAYSAKKGLSICHILPRLQKTTNVKRKKNLLFYKQSPWDPFGGNIRKKYSIWLRIITLLFF